MEISKRDRIRGRLLSLMPKGAVCAEIGVWEGDFSERILAETMAAELHLIDPWLYQPEFGDTGFGRRKNEHLMDEKYRMVTEKFKGNARVTIHRAMSQEALGTLPDAYFDWVYLDGNHHEPHIGQDIALSLQKVKPNGIIAGDDLNWKADELGAPVRRAVEAAVAALGPQGKLQILENQWLIRLQRE